jgi:alcohol dehydrogenase
MKAAQINAYGKTDVLQINENTPKPSLSTGQLLIQVRAVSINPFDWKVREGYMKDMMPLQFPATVGGDVAGIVTEVGEGVSDFKTGDEVYGSALVFNGGSGAFAEFVAINTKNAALKPVSVSFEEAAALPLVGSSAVQALEEHIKLQKGQKILIHGGAGGIGHVAIQIAKASGAYVATTVSTNDTDYVKEVGADEVIDYKTQKFEDILKDYDAVFDTVGGETTNKSFAVLKKGGILVSMAGQPDKEQAEQRDITPIGQFTQTNSQHLNRLTELVDSGKVKVHVDKIFPFLQIKEAFEHQEKNSPRGKVVIRVTE